MLVTADHGKAQSVRQLGPARASALLGGDPLQAVLEAAVRRRAVYRFEVKRMEWVACLAPVRHCWADAQG